MLRKLSEKAIEIICRLLIFIAPHIVSKSACLSYWGEPKIPESLK